MTCGLQGTGHFCAVTPFLMSFSVYGLTWRACGCFSFEQASYSLSESEYAGRESEGAPWVGRLVAALDNALLWLQPFLTTDNYEGLFHLVVDKVCEGRGRGEVRTFPVELLAPQAVETGESLASCILRLIDPSLSFGHFRPIMWGSTHRKAHNNPLWAPMN